jgi:hypothetical protein
VEAAVDRREHERGDEGRDDEADAALVAQRAQRGDQRRRDV